MLTELEESVSEEESEEFDDEKCCMQSAARGQFMNDRTQ